MSRYARMLGVAAFAIGSVLAGEALAHAELLSATPAENGSTAVSPTELDLKFSEALNLTFSGVKLVGPDRKEVATGAAALSKGDDTVLVVPVPADLNSGKYTVEWHVLSSDGHKTHGSYVFTVQP